MAAVVPSDEDSAEEPLLMPLRRSQSNTTSQLALVGSNLCPIESLDYEILENDVVKQDWRSRGQHQILQFVFTKWIFCFLIGIIVGLLGFFINLAVENVAGMKFVVTSNMMLSRKFVAAFLIFESSNLALALFSVLITSLIAPEAAGSGIPEVKAYLNGVDAPAIFSFRTLIVKITGSICIVSSSLNVGKAGPLVHSGACVAAIMTEFGLDKLKSRWSWLQVLKNDREMRDFVTCGSAAGIAAAFRAPVGGVLFALEEMASWWRSALLWRAFFTTAVVAMILRTLIDFCWRGKCGLFGKGGLIMYDVTSANISYHLIDVPPVLLLAFFGGLLGSIYNALLDKITRIYNAIHERGIAWKIALACAVSISTSSLLFGLPWIAPCRPCPPDAPESCPTIGRSGNYKKFQCPPGHYNDLASLFFNTNDDAIKNLFSKDTNAEFHVSSMLLFFATCFLLSILSYGVAAPAGLFVPVIVTGAAYGRFVGMLVGPRSTINHGLYAVLGSASLLGGSMRMTVSLCVIILELTNNLLLLPLVMIVLLVSKTVADLFNGNVYDLIMAVKGFPYLESHAEPYMRHLTVSDVVAGPLMTLNVLEKVVDLVRVLSTTGHNGFPVVDKPPPGSDSPVLYGLVLRSHILALLKSKRFVRNPEEVDSKGFVEFSADDFFVKRGVEGVGGVGELELSVEEMEMCVDLRPFTNTSPYTVLETMSLAKGLVLFRELGLRHLLVLPKISGRMPVVGVLTRHDFMPEHILSLHPTLVRSRWRRLRLLRFPRLRSFVSAFRSDGA